MITPTPDKFSYVQIDRPVIGGERFLSQVRQLGERILGYVPVSSISEIQTGALDVNEEEDWISHVTMPSREPVMKVVQNNDFRLILLHRGAPPERANYYKFGHVQGRLSAPQIITHGSDRDERGARIGNRYKSRLAALTMEFDTIARRHDAEPDNLRMYCDRIDVVNETGGDTILGVSPRPSDRITRVLHLQSVAAHNRLNEISPRTANPQEPWQVMAPFARVPADVDDAQYARLLDSFFDILPLRLALGPAQYSSQDRDK